MEQNNDWIYSPLTGAVESEYNELIESVEKALGFKLFIWQKTYIMRGIFRKYGSTTAMILRDLLQVSEVPLDYTQPSSCHATRFYRDELRDIKKKLDDAGIETRTVFFSKEDKMTYREKRGINEYTV